MTPLIFIIMLLVLSGIAFGTGAVRALARVILIGGAAVAALIVGAVVLQLMHP